MVTRLRKLGPNLSLTGVIVTLAVGVILPVILSTSVGIVSIALGEKANNLVIGVLVICFAVASIGGAVTATVLLGRKARTARLQADFLANVSHELRTPLSAIRMYAQTLQTGRLREDPQKIEECLATIVRETEWLETMVDRVLTWRSAAKDRLVLELHIAPVAGAVQTALDRFSLLIAPGEVELYYRGVDHRPGRSRSERDRHRAAQSADQRLQIHRRGQADRRAGLRSGQRGRAEGRRQRNRDPAHGPSAGSSNPFSGVMTACAADPPGPGSGSLSPRPWSPPTGGRLKPDSREGRGTSHDRAASRSLAGPPRGEATMTRHKDTILVIEDDRALREGLALNFELHGYQVDTAADGEEGMRKAFDLGPDLIVLDIMLPGWSGLDILAELRDRRQDVPVLILSARGTTDNKVEGLNIGADDYLAKPFELPELLARVEAMLRRRGVDRFSQPPVHLRPT